MNDEKSNIAITCKNCGNTFTGGYCNICGEKVYSPRDKKIWHLIEEATHFITHFEGTLFNTLSVLFTRPGKLSEDYCNGIRKKYFKPVSFFLLLVVLYLLFPVFEGLNQSLVDHMQNSFYGHFAKQKIENLQIQSGLTIEQISISFNKKAEKVSKFLLLILLPFSALFINALLFRKRRLFFDHFIFATEINIIFLLVGFLILPVFVLMFEWGVKNLFGAGISVSDLAIAITIYMVVSFYTAVAVRRFYKLRIGRSIVVATVFMLLYFAFILFIYKFILFMLVFWQIS